MKKMMILLLLLSGIVGCAKNNEIPQATNEPKEEEKTNTNQEIKAGSSVVLYFSLHNNSLNKSTDVSSAASTMIEEETVFGTTEWLAKLIQQETSATLIPIEVASLYPADFDAVVNQNHQEQRDQALPEIKAINFNFDEVDTVYLGFAIWSSDLPQGVLTFLNQVDLKGKTIVPFCTHNGYGAGNSIQSIQEAQPQARVTHGLAVNAQEIKTAQTEVQQWLKDLSLTQQPEEIALRITIDGQVLEGVLVDTALAQQISEHFPLTITMRNYGQREVYGSVDFTLDFNETGKLSFEEGEITYCDQNNTLAIFYSRSSQPNLTMEVVPIGRVTSPLTPFESLPELVEITFELANE